MFKCLCRFSLLALLSALLVYAPEILSGISPPYSIAAPQRILLRVALCSSEVPDSLSSAISAYQKQYPHVHLRITRLSEEQMRSMPSPYPDVILCSPSSAHLLPHRFTAMHASQTLLHTAVLTSSRSQAADAFAAYIDGAIAAHAGGH